MDNQYDFSDIAPISDSEFQEKIAELVKEPGFEHAVKYVMPGVDFPAFAEQLKSIPDKSTFQKVVMRQFLEMLIAKTTAGVTVDGIENVSKDSAYTYISNHRDIVLDASLLNYCLFLNGFESSEVAIGDNLLIYEWITNLVKINKSFIVKRNLRLTKALEAAKQLSAYIHYAIRDKHESVWIAQREGRAKDSTDRTQESVLKMLALDGGGTLIENTMAINIVPVTISYEYDPNDYLKAREFLMRRRDPEFKKTQRDDLFSMETGLLQYKGRVHYSIGRCINDAISCMASSTDKVESVKLVCSTIDNTIHSNYKIYPINYIAWDMLHGETKYSSDYTDKERDDFKAYLASQLAKVDVENVTEEEYAYMYEMMLVMYSNPLQNLISATNQ